MSSLIPTFSSDTDFRTWLFGVGVIVPTYGGLNIGLMIGPFLLSLEW